MNASSTPRRGSVIIVVAGIAAMLAAVATAYFVKVRSEADKTRVLVLEAQARVMLDAALLYVQETSRLGWQTEGYGWTDVRDGALGPRGPIASDGSLPVPTWWRSAYGTYPPPANFPVGVPKTSLLWPAPGSTMRGDLYAWSRPPYAIELTYAYNPVFYDIGMTNIAEVSNAGATNGWKESGVSKWPFVTGAFTKPTAKGALDPQPISSTWNDFAQGDSTPLTGASGLGWFRLYRETPEDRDNDGVPYYDRVAFPSPTHATFVVTCGAGATRGYRDWAEVLNAGAAGVFANDPAMFADLRADERVLWYRIEWSPSIGGGFDPVEQYFDNGGQYSIKSSQRLHSTRELGGLQPRNFVGTIKWIQRLDREPPTW